MRSLIIAWHKNNGVGSHADTPSGLSKHIKHSLLVFSFKINRACLVLGATMYRRNHKNRSEPLNRQCQAVIRIKNDKITHRWTDWSAHEQGAHIGSGIFVWLVREYLATKVLPNRICVLASESDLCLRDKELGLDWRPDYSHYVFEQNESFPTFSGWYI